MYTSKDTRPVPAVILSPLPRCQDEALDPPLPVILYRRGEQPNVLAGQQVKQPHIDTNMQRQPPVATNWVQEFYINQLTTFQNLQHIKKTSASRSTATSKKYESWNLCYAPVICATQVSLSSDKETRLTKQQMTGEENGTEE